MPMCQLAALNNIPMHIIYQCPMNNLLIIQFILSIPQLAYWHIATLANYSVQRIRIECKQLRRQVALPRIGQSFRSSKFAPGTYRFIIGYSHYFIYHGSIINLRNKIGTDSLYPVRGSHTASQHRRSGRFNSHYINIGIVFFQCTSHTTDSSTGSYPGNESSNLSSGIFPYFFSCGTFVYSRIGRVLKLL